MIAVAYNVDYLMNSPITIIILSMMKGLIKNRRFHILLFESLGSFILIYGTCSSNLHVAPDIIVAASFFLAVSLTG
jgi:hypothetical protein